MGIAVPTHLQDITLGKDAVLLHIPLCLYGIFAEKHPRLCISSFYYYIHYIYCIIFNSVLPPADYVHVPPGSFKCCGRRQLDLSSGKSIIWERGSCTSFLKGVVSAIPPEEAISLPICARSLLPCLQRFSFGEDLGEGDRIATAKNLE